MRKTEGTSARKLRVNPTPKREDEREQVTFRVLSPAEVEGILRQEPEGLDLSAAFYFALGGLFALAVLWYLSRTEL